MEPEPNQDWTAYTTIVTNKVRIDHRIRIDRMEKPFKVRQYVYNLLGEQATIRVVVGAPEGVWWGGVEKSSSISHMLRHPSARQCYFEMKPISAP